MKRYLILFSLCILTTLAGCGQNSGAAGFSESDLVLHVNGRAYECRMNVETVISHLGDNYEYAEGKSCAYDGLDKTFTFKEATFYTNPLPEGDLIGEIYTDNKLAATSKGISVSAEKADVLAAYGKPSEDAGTLLIYRTSEDMGRPALCFELENDTVAAIYLTMEQV